MSIGERIAEFCINTGYEDIPAPIREMVKVVLADMVGICCDGAKDASSAAVADYVRSCGGAEQATAMFRGFRAPVADAVMINGHQAHVDDYDDTGLGGHYSSILGSVTLGLGDFCGASGKDVIRAYALGMEVEYHIAKALMDPLMRGGWCSTPVFGAFGATAAAATLLGLNREQFANAVGIVCSKASGVTANFGSASKPYQVGQAAKNGVEAALLARCGLTGKFDAVEGTGGFAQAYARTELTEDAISFGERPWLLEQNGTVLKLYPCCLASHGAINGLFRMKEQYGFTAGDVESILAGVPGYANRALAFPDPKNETEARFSMNYALASVLVKDHVGLDSFTLEKIADPDIQTTMKKISREHAEEYKDIYGDETAPAILTVRLKDGRELRHTERLSRIGIHPEEFPDTWSKVEQKFRNCTEGTLTEAVSAQVFEQIRTLENLENIRELIAKLA